MRGGVAGLPAGLPSFPSPICSNRSKSISQGGRTPWALETRVPRLWTLPELTAEARVGQDGQEGGPGPAEVSGIRYSDRKT